MEKTLLFTYDVAQKLKVMYNRRTSLYRHIVHTERMKIVESFRYMQEVEEVMKG